MGTTGEDNKRLAAKSAGEHGTEENLGTDAGELVSRGTPAVSKNALGLRSVQATNTFCWLGEFGFSRKGSAEKDLFKPYGLRGVVWLFFEGDTLSSRTSSSESLDKHGKESDGDS